MIGCNTSSNMKTRKCKHCGTEFEPKRESAVFCRDRCRVAASRQRKAAAEPAATTEGIYEQLNREAGAAEIQAARLNEKAVTLRRMADEVKKTLT